MNERRIGACYGPGLLEFNMASLGRRWFQEGINESVDALLIHELAHHFIGNHFHKECCEEVPSGMFYDACCLLSSQAEREWFFRYFLPGGRGPCRRLGTPW